MAKGGSGKPSHNKRPNDANSTASSLNPTYSLIAVAILVPLVFLTEGTAIVCFIPLAILFMLKDFFDIPPKVMFWIVISGLIFMIFILIRVIQEFRTT